MKIEILNKPANAIVKVSLNAGESITSEAGAMVAMSGRVSVETTTFKKNQGSILSGLKRMIAGESFFVNHFTANSAEAEVLLAPTLLGDIFELNLQAGETIFAQSGSYLASEDSVNVSVSWQGAKNILSGESLFWVKLTGPGKVVCSTFGCAYPIQVNGDYIVDTGHIAAYDETLNFSLTKAGTSWLSSILGGEGIVCKFTGKGTVWCQSHNANEFGTNLGPKLKAREA